MMFSNIRKNITNSKDEKIAVTNFEQQLDAFIQESIKKTKNAETILTEFDALLVSYWKQPSNIISVLGVKFSYLQKVLMENYKKTKDIIYLQIAQNVVFPNPDLRQIEELIQAVHLEIKKEKNNRNLITDLIADITINLIVITDASRLSLIFINSIEPKIKELKNEILADFKAHLNPNWIITLSIKYGNPGIISKVELFEFGHFIFKELITEINSPLNISRSEVAKRLRSTLKFVSLIYLNYLDSELPKGLLENLINAIKKDFEINKNRDWLLICARSHITLLANWAKEISPIAESMTLTKSEGFLLSYKRAKLHEKIFAMPPIVLEQLTIPKKMHKKVMNSIHELTIERAIVEKIYHWTTQSNLENIIKADFTIYGNKTLRANMIPFQRNALFESDVENGDGDVVCFCPYMVDPVALAMQDPTERDEKDVVSNVTHSYGSHDFYALRRELNPKKFKDGLVRLTVNTDKIPSLNKYNQFFKLFDFGSPNFSYSQNITESLSIKIIHSGDELKVELKLKKKSISFSLSKKESIFYGNIYAINRFCMLVLFNAILKTSEDYYSNLMEYLSLFSDKNIKIILTRMAKSLIIFSEFNFNSRLTLPSQAISEIFVAKANQLYNLEALNAAEYKEAVKKLAMPSDTFVKQVTDEKSSDAKPSNLTVLIKDNIVSIEDKCRVLYKNPFKMFSRDMKDLKHPAVILEKMGEEIITEPCDKSILGKILALF